MNTTELLHRFLPFATQLNDHNIKWAIGASMLLALEGYNTEVHDIDIHVLLDDNNKLQDLLKDMNYYIKSPNQQYATKYFYTVTYNLIEIDILLGFIVHYDGLTYSFPFTKDTPLKIYQIENTTLYLASISEWKNAYTAMKRTDKLALLEKGPNYDSYH